MARPYSSNGSSLAARLATQYQQQFGRPADATDPQYAAWVKTALPQTIQADQTAYEKSKGRWNTFGKIATGAALAPFAALAAPALLGGGGAAAAGTGAATTGATTAGAVGATAGGSLLSHPLVGLGAQGVFGMLSQRSQNNAAKQALSAQIASSDRQLAAEQARLAQERDDMLAMREEEKKRVEADNLYRQSVLDAENEDRAYNRAITDRREAVSAQFQPYQQMAMARLGRFLRF